MIIARHNFAIYQLNYALYDETEPAAEGIVTSGEGSNGRLMFDVRTEYKPVKSSLYLNYISFRNHFRLTRPPKFTVDSVAADIGCGCFQVYFNKVPTHETALDLTNYDAELGGKRIKLVEAQVMDSSVVLFPPEDKRYLLKALTKYSGKDIGVQDADGNLVDVAEKLDMLQFREFFTQQVLERENSQTDSIYMFKERPIFEDQPVSRPENFKEYWMNTPLQDSN